MGAVVWKDLASEWRSREMVSAMLVFALLVIFIFNFALELNPQMRASLTSGILWVTFTFAGTLGLNRSMAVEKDRGCLDGLLLAPVDRSAIYFGKAFANLVFMLPPCRSTSRFSPCTPPYDACYAVFVGPDPKAFKAVLQSTKPVTVPTFLPSRLVGPE